MSLIINENITANGNTEAATINNPNNGTNIFQVVYVSGTFGGGTVAVQISNDGGSTWFAATNSSGAVTFSADGAERLFLLGNSNPVAAHQIKLRCVLSGATGADINISVADVR